MLVCPHRFKKKACRPRFFLLALLIGVSVFLGEISMPLAQPSSVDELIAEGASPKLIVDGFRFTEGPAADASGNLYFSDIGSNRIHYWNASNQRLSTIRENSGGADGLFVDRNGALWVCELKDKQLTKIDARGAYSVVADSFDDRPFTGPNDLWIDPYGGIYFSDSYGGSQVRTADHRVFYRAPSGKVNLVVDDFYKSNGLQGSRDGRWLYVSDYIANRVYRYAIKAPGQLGERRVFAEYRCDGMTLDNQSNLYLCTGNAGHGVVVFSSSGKEIGKIQFPENPANATFGGPDNQTLFVTANQGLYSLQMKVGGNIHNSPQKPLFNPQDEVAALIQPGAQLTQLATGFRIAQGPAVDARGDVIFSDLYHHRIMKWDLAAASLSLVREQPGGPDGLFVEADGGLLVCELTGRRFARLRPTGEYDIIAEQFDGTPLTGPNDVYVDDAGGIYFSDSYPGSRITHPPAHCVYYIAPGESKLKRIVDNHYKTKGIHLSPDGQWIYLADYGGRKVYRHRLLAPGQLGPPELFVDTRCGGLTIDARGNLYLSTVDDYLGILVYAPDGRLLGQVRFPEATTNAVFAGPDRDQLIVTTFKSIYAIPMSVKGMR